MRVTKVQASKGIKRLNGGKKFRRKENGYGV